MLDVTTIQPHSKLKIEVSTIELIFCILRTPRPLIIRLHRMCFVYEG